MSDVQKKAECTLKRTTVHTSADSRTVANDIGERAVDLQARKMSQRMQPRIPLFTSDASRAVESEVCTKKPECGLS